nr:hypothetical protein [Acidihalobacter ferrooxydans]
MGQTRIKGLSLADDAPVCVGRPPHLVSNTARILSTRAHMAVQNGRIVQLWLDD